jgi:APA family basic amino acid/polyamine antiporter
MELEHHATQPVPVPQSLHRALGPWGATAFVVTSMIGTGIFTVPAFVRAATGNGIAALGVWIAGAGLALSGALCYAELATRMPEAGGEYHYLTRVYGRLWGFLSGWISFFAGFSAPIAAASIAAVEYTAAIVPGWDPTAPALPWIDLDQGALAAAAVVVALAVVHARGVESSGRLQGTIAILVVCMIVGFVTAGLATSRGEWSGIVEGSAPTGAWWVALIQVSFAYAGWNAAAYLAGEVVDPPRTLPRALIGGTLVVVVLYLALNVLFLYALPTGQWVATVTVGHAAAESLFGQGGARVVSAIVALCIFGSVSAMTAAGPRVYYAMARDGLGPAAFRRLGRRGRAPAAATMAQAIVATALALTGAFESLLIYVGSALLLFGGLAVSAVYVVGGTRDPAPGVFRVPGYPVTPAIFIALVLTAWVYGMQERPIPTGAALLTMGGGVVAYAIGRARGWLAERPHDGHAPAPPS